MAKKYATRAPKPEMLLVVEQVHQEQIEAGELRQFTARVFCSREELKSWSSANEKLHHGLEGQVYRLVPAGKISVRRTISITND